MRNSIIDSEGFSALYEFKYGYMLVNKHDAYVGRSIQHYGEWSEDEVALFLEICQPGDQVIEVGSNIGTHTVPIAKHIGSQGRLHAYEPQRIVHQNLCANLSLNSIANVEAYQLAVSDRMGFAHLPEVDYNAENNFGGIRVHGHAQGVAVEQIIIDHHLELPSLKFLKVDAEDMELNVIRGAKQTIDEHRPFMYLENNPGSINEHALVTEIQNLGYEVFWHVTLLFNPNNFAGNSENIFGNVGSYNILCQPKEQVNHEWIQKYQLRHIPDTAKA